MEDNDNLNMKFDGFVLETNICSKFKLMTKIRNGTNCPKGTWNDIELAIYQIYS